MIAGQPKRKSAALAIMATIKPVGCISYNTPDYLMHVLRDLCNDNWIDDWRAIYHYGEGQNSITGEDKKDHFHVIVFPARKVDLPDLRDRFNEIDPDNALPIKCTPFRYSEPLNWIMYVLHDPDYLAAHAGTAEGDGKLQYAPIDIVSKEKHLFEIDYQRALRIRLNSNQKIMEAAAAGKRFMEILAEYPEVNPINLRNILAGMYEDIRCSTLSQKENR